MGSSDSEVLRRLSKDDIGKELDGCIVTAVKLIFERNGFVIFACKGGFSIKGSFAGSVVEGLSYRVSGLVTAYNDQPQISASSIEAADSSDEDKAIIAEFLKDNFKAVGKKTAGALADLYGDEVLEGLVNDPVKASSSIDGLTLDKATSIASEIEERIEFYKIILGLRKLGLSHKRANKIYDLLGPDCIDKISRNPYMLMKVSGIGFETCEAIARKLNMEPLSISRFEGAVVSAVNGLHESSGDTYLLPGQVRSKVMSILAADTGGQMPDELFDGLYSDALERAKEDKFIVIYRFAEGKCIGCGAEDEGARIASGVYFGTERAIKAEIEKYINAKSVVPDEEKTRSKIRDMGEARGITLDEHQEEALFLCMYSPIAIITGGPGTGKTTITSILAHHFKEEKIDFEFCAPTGRAAKRLSEASGVSASTIHRLLEMSAPSDDEDDNEAFFGRNRSNPLECRVVVVDEASMVDIFLFKALLDAMRPGSSLILVGDPEQLPSVGAGNVLEDMLSCPAIPSVRLKYIFRQDEESSIASNAVRILRGEMPLPGDDFEIIKTESDEEALHYVEELSLGNRNGDFAILSPTRRNLLGTEYLNSLLQSRHNEGVEDCVNVRSDLKLYPGDHVMQVRNNYSIEYYDPDTREVQHGVYNGEIGVFKGFDVLTGKYDVIFDDDRRVGYDKKYMADIELSYALSVHKSQGCEFDSVAVVLGKMNYRLSNRKLLYTAVTRGRNKVIIIDSGNRLLKMLGSESELQRKTSLPDFLKIVAARHEEADKKCD